MSAPRFRYHIGFIEVGVVIPGEEQLLESLPTVRVTYLANRTLAGFSSWSTITKAYEDPVHYIDKVERSGYP